MAVTEILRRFHAGELSPEIALMQLLIATEDTAATRAVAAPPLVALLDEHAAGCARIVAMLRSGVDPGGGTAPSVDEGIAAARRLFDWSVQQDEASSVALYSLGSEAILARATDEIIAWLDGLLTPATRVLDLGCGIGRLLAPLAPRVAQVHAIDVSPRMVEVATRRAAGLPNVRVALASGRDLAGVPPVDLVLAVDSFPYIVQAGGGLAAHMLDEIRRVLAPGGHLVICNYSYDGSEPDLAGFELLTGGAQPFALWDACVYVARTPSSAR